MNMMENDVFRGLLFAFSGTVILSILLGRFFYMRKRRLLSTSQVKATVTSVYCGNRKYRPTYEYFAEGAAHKVTSRSCHHTLVAENGESVSLYFIPGQPEKIYVPKEREKQKCLICSTIFALIGISHFCAGLALALGYIH